MNAVEYVKALHRLCKSQDGCFRCILDSEDGCIAAANRYECYENAVPIVEQWAKEHPVKTRQSEFLKMFPDAAVDVDDGILCIRPCLVEKIVNGCSEKSCQYCRREYWLTEVTDND